MRKLLLFFGMFTILSFVWLTCENQDNIEKKVKALGSGFQVDATEITRDYDKNEIAADQYYKNKIWTVRGIIRDIGKSFADEMYVSLEGDEKGIVDVRCYFTKAHENRLSGLTKGEHVKIRGECRGMGFASISFYGCVFE